MKLITTLTAVAAAALFAGCASTPTVTPQLQTARSTVHAAEADPNVSKYAPLELKRATESLGRADALAAKREALSDIDSVAYVATTQARTAMTLAKAQADEEAIKSAEADRERARADANGEAARRAQARAANATADANSARAQAANAQADAAAAQAQAANAQAQATSLQQELAELQARQTDRGMLVTLGDVLFETGRAEIKPNAQESLGKLAHYLSQHADRRILIEGFTDSTGSDATNLTLSQRRARAVAEALQSRGVDMSRIDTRGYGEQYPVASNSSTSDRAMNRRVEVYISDNDKPVRARG